MLGDVRLNEQGRALRVDSRGEQADGHVPSALDQRAVSYFPVIAWRSTTQINDS